MFFVAASDFCFFEAVDAAPDPAAVLGSASIFRLGARAAVDVVNAPEDDACPELLPDAAAAAAADAAAAAAAAAPIAKGFVVTGGGEAAGKFAFSPLPVPVFEAAAVADPDDVGC